ncbi:MAG: hypothetical protein LC802_11895 [Acidobacteria bacterium]|nr:hypothetical protein [Acidobacteriota bacterium]
MNTENIKPQDMSTSALISRLQEGWTATHTGWIHELAHRWATKFDGEVETEKVGENVCQFVARMNTIRLRGMDNVPCLMLTGEQKQLQAVNDFRRQASCSRCRAAASTPSTCSCQPRAACSSVARMNWRGSSTRTPPASPSPAPAASGRRR